AAPHPPGEGGGGDLRSRVGDERRIVRGPQVALELSLELRGGKEVEEVFPCGRVDLHVRVAGELSRVDRVRMEGVDQQVRAALRGRVVVPRDDLEVARARRAARTRGARKALERAAVGEHIAVVAAGVAGVRE